MAASARPTPPGDSFCYGTRPTTLCWRIMSDQEPKSVDEILDRIEEVAQRDDRVTLGHVIDALGKRSYGPFLIIPALIDISPVGSIPTLPTLLAAVIILISAQVVMGRQSLWVPGFLARRGISAQKARTTTDKLRGTARFLDRRFHDRLAPLTKGPFVRIAAISCILLALTVPPLELLPLATTMPMAAIACFGLALLVNDGLLMLIGMALALIAGGVGLSLLGSSGGSG
jgi:hypothetical protein